MGGASEMSMDLRLFLSLVNRRVNSVPVAEQSQSQHRARPALWRGLLMTGGARCLPRAFSVNGHLHTGTEGAATLMQAEESAAQELRSC
jgi:hypothetical protein